MSIARIGNFTGRPGQIDELKDFLYSIMPIIESAQGCESVQLFQSQEDQTKFTMIEVWDSVESHRESVKNIPQEKLAEIRPLLGSAPSGSYFDVLSAG